MSGRVRLYGKHGAGEYGRVEQSSTKCRRGNNPFGHNPECDCRDERPPQTVPYDEDCPAGHCDKPDHADCWREYDRIEREYKYRARQGGFLMQGSRWVTKLLMSSRTVLSGWKSDVRVWARPRSPRSWVCRLGIRRWTCTSRSMVSIGRLTMIWRGLGISPKRSCTNGLRSVLGLL